MMVVVAHLHLAGFSDWVAELVVTRLKPHHLLPTVVYLSGLLSAFFVNDIICLVTVPFVLKVTGRMNSATSNTLSCVSHRTASLHYDLRPFTLVSRPAWPTNIA